MQFSGIVSGRARVAARDVDFSPRGSCLADLKCLRELLRLRGRLWIKPRSGESSVAHVLSRGKTRHCYLSRGAAKQIAAGQTWNSKTIRAVPVRVSPLCGFLSNPRRFPTAYAVGYRTFAATAAQIYFRLKFSEMEKPD